MRRKPWGVVAVITPWNFPFAVPLWMLGPSLLEGNTAVFKPSEDTPAIGQRLVELFEEAGFPPGVVNLVHGDAEAGEALVKNPGVNVVLFTGSYDVGQRIQEVSAELARSHRRRRDGQQERRHRLRRCPARPGRDVRHSSAPSRRAASAASPRAGSSSMRSSSTPMPTSWSTWPDGCASAIRSTPATSPAPSSTRPRWTRCCATTTWPARKGPRFCSTAAG